MSAATIAAETDRMCQALGNKAIEFSQCQPMTWSEFEFVIWLTVGIFLLIGIPFGIAMYRMDREFRRGRND